MTINLARSSIKIVTNTLEIANTRRMSKVREMAFFATEFLLVLVNNGKIMLGVLNRFLLKDFHAVC